ncbi:hypothetical protein AAFP30_27900 [Gordonia sp. CPCC 205515]|uniref:hypothetical protein n=1 Tax=Gordonia sp. CPCC 205515 TaxID=3140791 RepID=UPI003AF3CDF6
MTTKKRVVGDLITGDLDAQIEQLKQRKRDLAAAGVAYVAALDEVEARKDAVKAAERSAKDHRQSLIDLGLRPREISRLIDETRNPTPPVAGAPAHMRGTPHLSPAESFEREQEHDPDEDGHADHERAVG